jgi:hypothetical protein
MHRGFAKLYRKLKEWEWYKDGPVKELYIHFLLSANHKDGSYKGQPIPRGSLISGRKSLSAQTSLSEQQIRRAINALESTGYIRTKTTSKSTMFTVIDFDTYNDYDAKGNQQTTSETTNKQPSDNQVATTNKNVKNENNVEESSFSTDLEKRVFQSLQNNYGDRVSALKYQTYFNLVKNLSDIMYSGVDVCTEVKRARIWEDNNPSKKKTPRGVPRFLCGWMDRAQNSGQRTIRSSSEPKQDYKEL